jgi:type IV pilus assembly protein PilB
MTDSPNNTTGTDTEKISVAQPYTNEKLHAHLSQLTEIDQSVLDQALAQSNEQHTSLEEIITEKDYIDEQTLGRIIADMIGKKHIALATTAIDQQTLHIIPEAVAKAQNTVAFKQTDTHLQIASSTPTNTLFYEQLAKKTGLEVECFYTTTHCMERAFLLYSKDITESFDEIIAQSVEESKRNPKAQPPIITIVDSIVSHAFKSRVSDIHIEPLEEHVLVRFRIDGILHDIVTLPSELLPLIVTRIKVMSKLRTDEHQASQDGKIHFKDSDTKKTIDIRVSIAPTTAGEKIVMRILAEESRMFSLQDLGIDSQDLEKLKKAYSMANGMILCTGPTGSGKTTTLYTILKLINTRDINIMTIEDPVEYQIDTINQMQVNPKAGVTFASGLRSIVRQDPDVILVGEIRDPETADIAINSAMTGHLVLSSVHTNDAATTFPRMTDLEVEPFLLSSTVNVVIAQRLVRKICTACKVSTEIQITDFDKHLQETIQAHSKKNASSLRAYTGKGCPVCHNTGYSGRIGIYEILEVSDEIKAAIIAKKSANEIAALAIENGMRTMLQDGLNKVTQGITTVEELVRVTNQNE